MSGVPVSRMGFVGHSLERPKRGQLIEPHSDDPVIHPNVTIASMTDRVAALVMRERGFLWWYLALIPTSLATLWLLVSLGYLFVYGVGVWGSQLAGDVGLCHPQLRLVDRHRLGRYDHLRAVLSSARRLAHFDQPHCRNHDAVRGGSSRHLSHYPSR